MKDLVVEDEPDMAALITMLFDRNTLPEERAECCGPSSCPSLAAFSADRPHRSPTEPPGG